MKAESQITESELEVMKILWEFGKATSSQIVERLQTSDKNNSNFNNTR